MAFTNAEKLIRYFGVYFCNMQMAFSGPLIGN